jgi:hypothetical protein
LSVSKMADTYAVRQADEEVSLTKPTFGRYRRTVRLRTEDRYTKDFRATVYLVVLE